MNIKEARINEFQYLFKKQTGISLTEDDACYYITKLVSYVRSINEDVNDSHVQPNNT